MKLITREELKAKLEDGDDFKLVMTMNEGAFHAAHIPKSLNVSSPDQVGSLLTPDDDIVVYCTHPECVASQSAYYALSANGFVNVRRYAGGIADWVAAGYRVEGSA